MADTKNLAICSQEMVPAFVVWSMNSEPRQDPSERSKCQRSQGEIIQNAEQDTIKYQPWSDHQEIPNTMSSAGRSPRRFIKRGCI